MSQPIGNEANLAKVRQLMAQNQQVQQGGNMTHGIFIDYVSQEGNHYTGTVVVKRPTVMDYMKMGGLKSEYLRQAGVQDANLVDDTVKILAHALATLKVVVVKCPEWLMDMDNIREIDVLYHVFDKYEEWDYSFRKPVQAEPIGAGEASESAGAVDTSEVLREPAAD